MKRKNRFSELLRPLGALALAGATLWTVSVTAGSATAADAWAALRQEGIAELLEGLDLSPEQREQLRADMLEHLAETIAGDADDEDDPDEPDEPDGEEH